VPGMTAQRRGWLHRAGGDSEDTLHRSDVTAPSCVGAREVSVPFSRVPPSFFESAAHRPYGTRRHNVTKLTLDLPHSTVQWRGWPHRTGVWRNNAGVGFLGGARGPAWWGFALDPSVRSAPEHLMLRSGEWVWRHGPVVVDPYCPRARWSPARGGVWPRARRSFARGGVQPSSEAKFRCGGAGSLERGGISPGGVGAGCLLGRWRYPGRGHVRRNLPLVGSFIFLLFRKKLGSPRLLGDPYGRPR
jgi:hypothetical protein